MFDSQHPSPKDLLTKYLNSEMTDQELVEYTKQLPSSEEFEDELDTLCLKYLDKINKRLKDTL